MLTRRDNNARLVEVLLGYSYKLFSQTPDTKLTDVIFLHPFCCLMFLLFAWENKIRWKLIESWTFTIYQ